MPACQLLLRRAGEVWGSTPSRLGNVRPTRFVWSDRCAPEPSASPSTPRCAALWVAGRKGANPRLRARPASRQVNRFKTQILATRKNLKSLLDVPGKWIDRVRRRHALDKLILDLDSSDSETYGCGEGSSSPRWRTNAIETSENQKP